MTNPLVKTVSEKLTEELERLKSDYRLRQDPKHPSDLFIIDPDDVRYSGSHVAKNRGKAIMALLAKISSYRDTVSPYQLQKDLIELRGEMKSTSSGVGFLVKGKGKIDEIIKIVDQAQIEYEKQNSAMAAIEKVSDELKKELQRLKEDYGLTDDSVYGPYTVVGANKDIRPPECFVIDSGARSTGKTIQSRDIAKERGRDIIRLLDKISYYDANTKPGQLQEDLRELQSKMKSTNSGIGFFVTGKDNVDKIIKIADKIAPAEPKAKVSIMDKIRRMGR